MTNLELCQALVRELSIQGGSIASTSGQSGKLRLAVEWIGDACLWVDNLWRDWKYLWVQYEEMLSVGSRTPPVPSTPAGVKVRQWRRACFVLNPTSSTYKKLKFLPYEKFKGSLEYGVKTNATPSIITVLPDNSLRLDCPSEDTHVIRGEFYRRPTKLSGDNAVPLMPEEYHRIILARAAIMYGNKQDAPEVISGFEAEYKDLLEKLQSDQLDAFQYERMAGQDVPVEMGIPGQEEDYEQE